MLNILIEDCNKEIVKHNAGKRSYPHWMDFVLLPIAREIGLKIDADYEVSGVYGLRKECTVRVGEHYLRITPKFKTGGEIEELHYDTDENTKPWNMNGLGIVTKPLPGNIDEIHNLLISQGE